MKNTLKTLTLALAAGLLASAQLFAVTATPAATSLQVAVSPEAKISVGALTTLTGPGATDFSGSWTGTTTITYSIRTTTSGGNGTITVALTEFTGLGYTAVANSKLTYTCADANATSCGATPIAAVTTGFTVDTFGPNMHGNGNTATVVWVLADDPAYQTGTSTATATFTLSAT